MFGHQDDLQTLNDQAAAADPQAVNNDWSNNQQNDDNSSQSSAGDDSNNDEANQSLSSDGPVTSTAPAEEELLPANTQSAGNNDDLLSIKQQALNQLSPIVNHLDQTPEEKFRTTMMMIQASDDQSLLKTAYDAAQQISDEKVKAQALLDIVNEINYFTHPTT